MHLQDTATLELLQYNAVKKAAGPLPSLMKTGLGY